MITRKKATGLAMAMATAWLGSGIALAQSPGTTTAPTAKTATPTRQVDAATALFADWDTNHDRMLSPAEFATGWQQLQAGMAMRRWHEQFVTMDTSKDGCLDAAEYARLELVRKAGTSAPPLSAFDTKKTQCLDFEEYMNAVKSMLKNERR